MEEDAIDEDMTDAGTKRLSTRRPCVAGIS